MHRALEALKAIDFVTAWKAVSIALTGAFGILGLLTDFKNNHTHKITKWGWISLAGIVVSAVFGVAAQLKESNDNAKKALELAKRTDMALEDMERMLSSLDGAEFTLEFEVPCSTPSFAEFCKAVKQEDYGLLDDSQSPKWKYWLRDFRRGITFEIDVFENPSDADAFFSDTTAPSDLEFKLPIKRGSGTLSAFADQGSVHIDVSNTAILERGYGKIRSARDLRGKDVIVSTYDDELDGLDPDRVVILFKNAAPVFSTEPASSRTNVPEYIFRYKLSNGD
jgi:hypothetical protein